MREFEKYEMFKTKCPVCGSKNKVHTELMNVDNNLIELGYVPRYYAKEVANLLKDNVNYSAMIKKIRFDSQNTDENITASVKLLFD